jgi:ABC-type nitrate/sulfonate/bicarbonate transport system permease component
MNLISKFLKQLKQKKNSLLLGTLSIILFFAVWELLAQFSVINSNILPSFSVVIKTIYQGILEGTLLLDILASIKRVIIGYLIGSFLGVAFGSLSALNRSFRNLVRPIIDLIRPIPPIAWIPIALLWFGFGDPSAYFLVALGGFFPVYNNTFLGIELVEKGTTEVAVMHGATKKYIFRQIVLPQALPHIFAGLRTGLGVAWMIVITAELVGAQSGLGYMIQVSRAQLQSENVVAGMVVIGIIGLGLDRFAGWLEKVLMPWRKHTNKLLNEGI